MSITIDKCNRFLQVALEDQYGVAPDDDQFRQIRARDLTLKPYQGDKITREYICAGRNSPDVKTTQHTMVSFSADYAGTGDVTIAPEIDMLLRACGLNRFDEMNKFNYLPAEHKGEVDSCAIRVREGAGAGKNAGDERYYQHQTLGVRGTVGIEIAIKQDPLFKFDNFLGSYGRPVDGDLEKMIRTYKNQLSPLVVTNTNTPTVKLGNVSVSFQKFSSSNIAGFDVSRLNLVGEESSSMKVKRIEASMTIKATDWTSEFNIYELLESHEKINRVPFELLHGTSAGNRIGLSSPEVQISEVTEGYLDDDSRSYDLSLILLVPPTVSFT